MKIVKPVNLAKTVNLVKPVNPVKIINPVKFVKPVDLFKMDGDPPKGLKSHKEYGRNQMLRQM